MMLYEEGKRSKPEVDFKLCTKNSAGEELRAPVLDNVLINYIFVIELPIFSEATREISIMGWRFNTTVGIELDYFADRALKNLELVRSELPGCTLDYPYKDEQNTSPKKPLPGSPPGDRDFRSVVQKGENY